MAAKTPDTIRVSNAGDLRMIVATFSDTDIDDNDTWASGIKGAIAWDFQNSIDGPQDCTVDAYSNGTFTFGSEANATGRLVIWARGY